MAPATIPTTEPTALIAGLTWRWDRTFPDYAPSGGWALKYTLRGASVLDITAAANAAQTGWEITVAAADTSPLIAGLYPWVSYVESGSERYVVATGTFQVAADPILAQAGDLTTHPERALALVETAIEARLAVDMSAYSFRERSVQREELEQLYAVRMRLKSEVAAKRTRGGMGRRVEWWPRVYI